jgi:hypothetical protein
MSLVTELGARIRGVADELPFAAVSAAAERLRVAIDLLTWVRQAAVRPVGIPQLSGALEHSEYAARALLVAQEELAGYLTAIGLYAESAVASPQPGQPFARPAGASAGPAPGDGTGPPPLRRWWAERVNALTSGNGESKDSGGAADSTELIRRVTGHTRSGSRDGLRNELLASRPPIGLGLAALAPTALRSLATELLGRPPVPGDLDQLNRLTSSRVRDLLPGLRTDVARELLARVCRVPARTGEPIHPADSAIACGVLVGALLDRVGGGLDRHLTEREPVHA